MWGALAGAATSFLSGSGESGSGGLFGNIPLGTPVSSTANPTQNQTLNSGSFAAGSGASASMKSASGNDDIMNTLVIGGVIVLVFVAIR